MTGSAREGATLRMGIRRISQRSAGHQRSDCWVVGAGLTATMSSKFRFHGTYSTEVWYCGTANYTVSVRRLCVVRCGDDDVTSLRCCVVASLRRQIDFARCCCGSSVVVRRSSAFGVWRTLLVVGRWSLVVAGRRSLSASCCCCC